MTSGGTLRAAPACEGSRKREAANRPIRCRMERMAYLCRLGNRLGKPIVPVHPMEVPMTRFALGLAVLAAILLAGCAEYPISEDRSDEVWPKHRIPSK